MRKFSDIIGQKAIIEHLYNALRTGSISHAYIISGDTGSGRKTIASIFAAALQCEDLEMEEVPEEPAGAREKGVSASNAQGAREKGGSSSGAQGAREKGSGNSAGSPAMRPRIRLLEPCGKCLSCMQAQSGNQPDIITITHAKANSIGVDEIRRMRADLQIILIANGLVSFLPTILSRCVVLQTRAVEEAQIARFLQREKDIPEDQAQILARFAGGNPGQALLLTEDQEFLELRDRTVDFLSHLGRSDAMRVSEFASGIDPGRRDDVLAFVMMWYRDVLLYFSTQNSENLIFQEDIQYIIEAAGMLGYERLGVILDEIDKASRRLKSNVAADSVFEIMFLNIRQQYRKRR